MAAVNIPLHERHKCEQNIITAQSLRERVIVSQECIDAVVATRAEVHDILHHKSSRLLVLIGPHTLCDASIPASYFKCIADLQTRYCESLLLITMFSSIRAVYAEFTNSTQSPYDAHVLCSREILREGLHCGVAVGVDSYDPRMPNFVSDLLSFATISEAHQGGVGNMSSMSHMPHAVGVATQGYGLGKNHQYIFQNACRGQRYPCISDTGSYVSRETAGNQDLCALIQGSQYASNYDASYVREVVGVLKRLQQPQRVMIDCAQVECTLARQEQVLKDVLMQRAHNPNIVGVSLHTGFASPMSPYEEVLAGVKQLLSHVH